VAINRSPIRLLVGVREVNDAAGQIVYTLVLMSVSSIISYPSKDGDAQRRSAAGKGTV